MMTYLTKAVDRFPHSVTISPTSVVTGCNMDLIQRTRLLLVLCAAVLTCCSSGPNGGDDTNDVASDVGVDDASLDNALPEGVYQLDMKLDVDPFDTTDGLKPNPLTECRSQDYCFAGLGKPTLDPPDDASDVRNQLSVTVKELELLYLEDGTVLQVIKLVDKSNSIMTVRRRALGPIPDILVNDELLLTTGPDLFRLEKDPRVVIEWAAFDLDSTTEPVKIDVSTDNTPEALFVLPGPTCDGSAVMVDGQCLDKAVLKIVERMDERYGSEGFYWVSGAASGCHGVYVLVDYARASDPIRFSYLKTGWFVPDEDDGSRSAPLAADYSPVRKSPQRVRSATLGNAACQTPEQVCQLSRPWFTLSGNADGDFMFRETALVKLENGTGLQHFRFEGFDDFSRWTIGGAIEVLPGTKFHLKSEVGFGTDTGEMQLTRDNKLVYLAVIEPLKTDVPSYSRTFQLGDVFMSVKTVEIGTDIFETIPNNMPNSCDAFVKATLEITLNGETFRLSEGDWVSTDDFIITVPMAADSKFKNCINYIRPMIAYEYVSRVW